MAHGTSGIISYDTIHSLFDELKKRYPVVDEMRRSERQGFLSVEQKDGVSMVTALKMQYGFSHLSFLTAVDHIEDGYFSLVYMLRNHAAKLDVGVKVAVPREPAEAATMDTIHHLWKQAATYQRELYEMFGISFPGSPRMEEPFILEGWDNIPPMRREFDTKKYSEETYFPRPGRTSENPSEYMAASMYPEHSDKGGK